METRDYEVLRNAIRTFGNDAQIDMLIEEMSELTKALLKARRAKSKNYHTPQVVEELVDVEICLDQLKLLLGDGSAMDQGELSISRILRIHRDGKIKRLSETTSMHKIRSGEYK